MEEGEREEEMAGGREEEQTEWECLLHSTCLYDFNRQQAGLLLSEKQEPSI